MNNINKFIDNYLSINKNFISDKNEVLEVFRKKEDDLRTYEELLSELEKKNIESKLSYFKNIQTNIYLYLKNFNTDDIADNVENVQIVIDFLNQKKQEFSKIAEVFISIEKTWLAFNSRRNKEERDSLFISEINDKFSKLKESFNNATDDDISRVEDESNDLKQDILKVISIFEELYLILEKNVFIGKEANELKEDIESFLKNEFYTAPLIDLIKAKEKITESLKEISSNHTVYLKKALPVIKLQNKLKKDLTFYTVRFDNYILEYQNENIDLNNSIIEETNKFVYIDNYPEKGIFKIEDIKSLMNISEDQFAAMSEFDVTSTKMFFLSAFLIILFSLLSTISVINLFTNLILISSISSAFYFYFKYLEKYIENKYKLKDLFYFIPTNFYFISIGNSNFNYKELIFNILIKADKTILKQKGE